MALLPILHFPDPRLKRVAEPVKVVNEEIKQLVDDMLQTMYENNGIGLAATQVGILHRVIVYDVSREGKEPGYLINPELLKTEGESKYKEGCLSIPGVYEEVCRPATIQVKGLNLEGKEICFEAQSLLATCIQHEIDHLNGTLFIDHLSRLKQQRAREKLKKSHDRNL